MCSKSSDRVSSIESPTHLQSSLQTTIILGKTESSRKRERPNIRWIDSIKEARGVNMQELSRAVKDTTLWTPLILRFASSQSQLNGTEHTSICLDLALTLTHPPLTSTPNEFSYSKLVIINVIDHTVGASLPFTERSTFSRNRYYNSILQMSKPRQKKSESCNQGHTASQYESQNVVWHFRDGNPSD